MLKIYFLFSRSPGETECFTVGGNSEKCRSDPINVFCFTDDPVVPGRQDFSASFGSEPPISIKELLLFSVGVQERDLDVEEGGLRPRHVTELPAPHLREGNHRVRSLLQLQLKLYLPAARSQLPLSLLLSPADREVQTECEEREMFLEVLKVHVKLSWPSLQVAALLPVPPQPVLAPGSGPFS